ncbi:hypothetical protein Taro_002010 [Colocasia esculenta]|uniref:Uncharacterized protein n=1 Tax=Colocasia esculenta TaxID=4460 RepID=A0A843TCU2_COLES|nr:hypothetical protein [Colocasia esculenta]
MDPVRGGAGGHAKQMLAWGCEAAAAGAGCCRGGSGEVAGAGATEVCDPGAVQEQQWREEKLAPGRFEEPIKGPQGPQIRGLTQVGMGPKASLISKLMSLVAISFPSEIKTMAMQGKKNLKPQCMNSANSEGSSSQWCRHSLPVYRHSLSLPEAYSEAVASGVDTVCMCVDTHCPSQKPVMKPVASGVDTVCLPAFQHRGCGNQGQALEKEVVCSRRSRSERSAAAEDEEIAIQKLLKQSSADQEEEEEEGKEEEDEQQQN